MKYWQTIRNFSFFYLFLAVLETISHPIFPYFPYLRYVSKPLIMISLIGIFTYLHRRNFRLWHWTVIAAFVFSLLGDILLLFEQEVFFLLGLSAFLIAHIAYIIAFQRRASTYRERALLTRRPFLPLPFVLYAIGLVSLLYSDLGNMLLPVAVYSTVILVMVLASLNRWDRVPMRSFVMVFAGALLFMVSDSLIAVDKFTFDVPLSSTWIMLTYMAAQYLITMGLLEMDVSEYVETARFN